MKRLVVLATLCLKLKKEINGRASSMEIDCDIVFAFENNLLFLIVVLQLNCTKLVNAVVCKILFKQPKKKKHTQKAKKKKIIWLDLSNQTICQFLNRK